MNWLRVSGDTVLLALHIQPGARKTEVVGLQGEALKLRVAAPPVDGKANEALIASPAGIFGIPNAQVILVSGQTSRSKRVSVCCIDATQATNRLPS